jgi:hypothetical protein
VLLWSSVRAYVRYDERKHADLSVGAGITPRGALGWPTPAGFSGLFAAFKYRIVLVRTAPGVPAARAGQIVHAQLTRAAPHLASADYPGCGRATGRPA